MLDNLNIWDGWEMRFTINSKEDKIENATVCGRILSEAWDKIEEILMLNGHTHLSDTDWYIYYEEGDFLVVENGIEL